MNINKAIESLKNHKAQNQRVTWIRPCKVRKEYADVSIVKSVSAIVRAGIDYENMKSTLAKNENGRNPEESAGLPWGVWQVFPFSILHKGVEYIRLYKAAGLEFASKVSYTMNGKPVDAETVKPFCLASEFSEGVAPDCFTIKAESLVSIG